MRTGARGRFARRRHRAGFTVIEVLVVVGIVALLIGILAPALRAVKANGRRTVELSAARQLMAGYAAYAAANRDAVLPGYLDKPTAFAANGQALSGGQLEQAKLRYVWRLAPYINYNLRGLYTNENEELLERLENEDYTTYLYKASLAPSLGLNSDWVGGDSRFKGFLRPDDPLRQVLDMNRYYVRSMSQVVDGSRLMVFASARGKDPHDDSAGVAEGYFHVSSPYFSESSGYRWSGTFSVYDEPAMYGNLSPRHSGRVVCAFMDAHTDSLSPEQLKDMRHWANWATEKDWRLPRLEK